MAEDSADAKEKESAIFGTKTKYESFDRSVAVSKSAYSNNSTENVTFKYNGEYDTLKSEKPSYGDDWEGLKVISASLVRLEGGEMGELTVTCGEMPPAESSTSTSPYLNTVEVTCAEISQPLAFNPNFPKDDETQWCLFLASPAKIQSQCRYLENPDDPNSAQVSLPDSLTKWAKLYNKGITTYMAYQPVVTKTTESKDAQTPSGIGKISSNPPDYSNLATQWLKTGDSVRHVRTRSADGTVVESYVRTEQWTGAENWPAMLYSNT